MPNDSQSEEPFVYKPSWSSRIVFVMMLMASIGVSALIVFIIMAFFFAPQRVSPEMGRVMRCQRHLSQIGLALRAYHDHYGSFPPAFTVDSHGKKLHSWRTLVLPFIGQQELYDKIDLSKAWDDLANAEARKVELNLFRCPASKIPSNHANYLAILGEEFAFSALKTRTMTDFVDGLKETAMVSEVPNENSVEWMCPEDIDGETLLAFTTQTPLTHPFHILQTVLAEGYPQIVSLKSPLEARRALLTIDGGDDASEALR